MAVLKRNTIPTAANFRRHRIIPYCWFFISGKEIAIWRLWHFRPTRSTQLCICSSRNVFLSKRFQSCLLSYISSSSCSKYSTVHKRTKTRSLNTRVNSSRIPPPDTTVRNGPKNKKWSPFLYPINDCSISTASWC